MIISSPCRSSVKEYSPERPKIKLSFVEELVEVEDIEVDDIFGLLLLLLLVQYSGFFCWLACFGLVAELVWFQWLS